MKTTKTIFLLVFASLVLVIFFAGKTIESSDKLNNQKKLKI